MNSVCMVFRGTSRTVFGRAPRVLRGIDAVRSVQTAPRPPRYPPRQQIIPSYFSSSSSSSSSSANGGSGDDDGPAVNIQVDVNDNLKIPGAEKGGRKLAAVYTCKICDTRSVKQFTERAYNYGVVIATCPGCNNRHLLADRLGYFDNKPVDLGTIAKENGESLKSIGEGVTEIDLEDLIGKEKMQELVAKANVETS